MNLITIIALFYGKQCLAVFFFTHIHLMPSAARQLQRTLETGVFHTAAWGELHPHGRRPAEAWSHPAAHQRHKGAHFRGLRLARLGSQTSVPR